MPGSWRYTSYTDQRRRPGDWAPAPPLRRSCVSTPLEEAALVAIEGDLDATELADIVAVTVALAVVGALAATDAMDVVAADADVHDPPITGTLAATEPTDQATIDGDLVFAGAFAANEGVQDNLAAAGAIAALGDMAATEAPDTAAMVAALGAVGMMAANDNPDTVEFAIALAAVGTMDIAEGPDVAALAGGVGDEPAAGDLAINETPDTAAFAGFVADVALPTQGSGFSAPYYWPMGERLPSALGSLRMQEAPDLVAFTGGVVIDGALGAREAPDDVHARGVVAVVGLRLVIGERPDMVYLGGEAVDYAAYDLQLVQLVA